MCMLYFDFQSRRISKIPWFDLNRSRCHCGILHGRTHLFDPYLCVVDASHLPLQDYAGCQMPNTSVCARWASGPCGFLVTRWVAGIGTGFGVELVLLCRCFGCRAKIRNKHAFDGQQALLTWALWLNWERGYGVWR